MARYFEVIDGILYHLYTPQERVSPNESTIRQVALPLDWKYKALQECHDSNLTGGHFGFNKTLNKIRQRYWWDRHYADIKSWIDTCKLCAMKKGHRPDNAGLMNPIVSQEPFETVGMDFFGPLPTSKNGNIMVLVITDHFSKFVELFAMKRGTEVEVAKCLVEQIIARHGPMQKLISDRGQSFVSQVIQEVYKLFKIRKINTSAWHPQANGQTERFNKSLANMLTVYCEEYHEKWDEYLPYLAFCYNSGASETTKISPFKVIYGRDPRFPTELGLGTANYTGPGALAADIEANFKTIRDIVLANTGLAQHKMIIRADKTKPRKEYRVGDKVWLYTLLKTTNEKDKNNETVRRAKKLKFPWQGPYEVV